jgi:hypothetical protein
MLRKRRTIREGLSSLISRLKDIFAPPILTDPKQYDVIFMHPIRKYLIGLNACVFIWIFILIPGLSINGIDYRMVFVIIILGPLTLLCALRVFGRNAPYQRVVLAINKDILYIPELGEIVWADISHLERKQRYQPNVGYVTSLHMELTRPYNGRKEWDSASMLDFSTAVCEEIQKHYPLIQPETIQSETADMLARGMSRIFGKESVGIIRMKNPES